MSDLCLLPSPRVVDLRPSSKPLPGVGAIRIEPNSARPVLLAAEQLQQAIRAASGAHFSLRAAETAGFEIILDSKTPGVRAQGYALRLSATGIAIQAADTAGIVNGVRTLIQIISQTGASIPEGRIEDYPDFPARGVMLDVSRDKVPTMDTLYRLVDMLASWKVNQLQLYTEHTFAYSQHPTVWAQASPMTHQEMLELDQYCADRCVELVANQNSFGHMARWLCLPEYLHLAEAPDGFDAPWGGRWEGPFSLCPTDPRCLELLGGMYDELLPHFSSPLFNVGCDETWDIGQGRSREQAKATSKTRIYFDFLLRVHQLVQSRGRRMMFWGDIILHQPQLISELPRDIIALKWGYEADEKFDEHGRAFAQAGVPFYVCPGTSSWNSFVGRTDNAIANLHSAAINGLKHGAIGYLNTDWGDNGHLQYLPVSYLGFAVGAAVGWCPQANTSLDICRALDAHAFADLAGKMGKSVWTLGNVYKSVFLAPNTSSSSSLFNLMVLRQTKTPPEQLTMAQLDAAAGQISDGLAMLSRSRMQIPDAALVRAELETAAAMLSHAVDRGRWMLGNGPGSRELAGDIHQLIGRHQSLWLARNRPGGLADSTSRLVRASRLYDA